MTGPALNREEISELLKADRPLISGAPNPKLQLQPNGFDLTIGEIETLDSPGVIHPGATPAALPERTLLHFTAHEPTKLGPGPYLVTFNETINMPVDLLGLVRPRSTLLRCGAGLHTGVWDAGYSGRSQALLEVHNASGLTLYRDARIGHMIFIRMGKPPSIPYQGRYQGEGMSDGKP